MFACPVKAWHIPRCQYHFNTAPPTFKYKQTLSPTSSSTPRPLGPHILVIPLEDQIMGPPFPARGRAPPPGLPQPRLQPQPPRHRSGSFSVTPFIRHYPESGDDILISKTTPLITNEPAQLGPLATWLRIPAGERAPLGPLDLTGKPQPVFSIQFERTTRLLPASGESKRIISHNDQGQAGPSSQLEHTLRVHSPERVRSTETTLQVCEDL